MTMADFLPRKEIYDALNDIGGCGATDEWAKGYDSAIDTAINIIESMPAADVVPVVRCKDCIFREFLDSYYGGYCCEQVKREVQLDDYCSFGERKELDNGC